MLLILHILDGVGYTLRAPSLRRWREPSYQFGFQGARWFLRSYGSLDLAHGYCDRVCVNWLCCDTALAGVSRTSLPVKSDRTSRVARVCDGNPELTRAQTASASQLLSRAVTGWTIYFDVSSALTPAPKPESGDIRTVCRCICIGGPTRASLATDRMQQTECNP